MPTVEVKDYTTVFTQPIFKNQNGEWYRDVGYSDSVDLIRENFQGAAKSFISIGYYLKHMKEHQLFKEGGYQNIWECAQAEFGLSQAAASRYMNMNDAFSLNGNTPMLDEKYIDFSKSQLQEMLILPEEKRDKVLPSQTVSEIRQTAKEEKAVTEPSQEEIISFYKHSVEDMDKGLREDLKDKLKERYRNAYRGGGGLDYTGSARGIKINKADEITWLHLVKLINQYIPMKQKSSVNNTDSDEETQLPGQMNVADYPGIVPDSKQENCPPNITQCMRQEWGTNPQQQHEGSKECARCWEENILSPSSLEIIDISSEPLEAVSTGNPRFKNNDERKTWISNYKEWGLWYRDENIDINYYKYDFSDGSRLIAAEYPQREAYWADEKEDEVFFHLLEKGKVKYDSKKTYDEKYRNSVSSITEIVEYLKLIKQ